MAENEAGPSAGKDLGFFILVVIGLLFLWAVTGGGEKGGVFGIASSTSPGAGSTTEDIRISTTDGSGPASPRSVQAELRSAERDLDRLREDVRTAKIWGTLSSQKDTVSLYTGDVWNEDEDAEYLILEASTQNEGAIDISGWSLVSYVTGERATIPQGVPVVQTGRVNVSAPIQLYPGERIVVVSGESPVGVSFRENMCTGYLDQFQDFSPTLQHSCPRPLDEMERFGSIPLDDDDCYAYVRTLPSCRLVTADLDDVRPRPSSACRTFVDNQLTYNGCVANHRFDTDFAENDWRVFLEQRDELWRSEREIIRLVDRSGSTVTVLEY